MHAQGGIHYKTRIPKFGRDIAYHYHSCDLLAVGASSEVYRLNLDEGRFMTSLATEFDGINVGFEMSRHTIENTHILYT